MKTLVSNGLLTLLGIALVATLAKGCGVQFTQLLHDENMICGCGSRDVNFVPAVGPRGAVHNYFTARCARCGQSWSVVDIAWSDPAKLMQATVDAILLEPAEYIVE